MDVTMVQCIRTICAILLPINRRNVNVAAVVKIEEKKTKFKPPEKTCSEWQRELQN
jgi:hypothetical protein